MATFLYINPDPDSKARASLLGCGWMAAVPPQYASVAAAPCVIVRGEGTTTVLPENTTAAAVAAAAAPILAAEQAADAVEATRRANGNVLRTKAQAALAANATYLAQPAIPAGTLTTAQLGTALRIIRTQLDAITRQNNAIIRLTLNQLEDVSDT